MLRARQSAAALALGALVGACSLGFDGDAYTSGSGSGPGGSDASPDGSPRVDAEAGSPNDAATDAPVDAGPPYAAAVRADAPIAYFRFEEPSGTVCANEITGSPVACVYGADVTRASNGAVGSCMRFPTSGLASSVTGPTDFPNDAPFAIEMWLSVESIGNRTIFSQMRGPEDQRTGTWMLLGETNAELFTETWVNGAHYLYTNGVTPFPFQRFVHVVLNHTAQDDLYVDGVLKDGGIVTNGLMRQATMVPMLLGGMVGCIDELAIYDKALSANRIVAHIAAR